MKNLNALKKISFTVIGLLSFVVLVKAQSPEERIEKMKLIIPKPILANNNYVGAVRTGNLIFLSGKGPRTSSGTYLTGKVGQELKLDDGVAAAKLIALAQLGELKAMLGELSKVKRIVKVNGFVNSTADFTGQSGVIDGFSDMMVSIFGEIGKHARTSVGVPVLPLNMAVEIEMIVEVVPE
ncbi:MAG: RidA family protein [Pedobacter sp.]|nr:RidA family protein [Pedobacter sp.]